MKRFNLDIVNDILFMVDYECPKDMFGELFEFQCDCEKMDNCFDCWYRTVSAYQYEQSLKSANDESEGK